MADESKETPSGQEKDANENDDGNKGIASTRNDSSSGGTTAAKTTLERLTNEELVQYIKKQAAGKKKLKYISDGLTVKVSELEAANKELKDQNNDITKEISILNEKNQELTKQLQDSPTDYEDIVTQKDQALAENRNLLEELKSCSNKLQERESHLKSIQKKANRMLEDAKSKIGQMQDKITELEPQLQNERMKNETLVQKLELSEQDLLNAVKEKDQLLFQERRDMQNMDDMVEELSNAIHEKAVLSESIEKIQIELNAALNAKDNVSNDLSKVTEELKDSVEHYKTDKQHLNAKLEELSVESSNKSVVINKLEQELQSVNAQLNELHENLTSQQQTICDRESKIKDLEDQLASLTAEIVQSTSNESTNDKEGPVVEDLKDKFQTLSEDYEMMQSQLNDLMVYKDSILSNLEESQAAENKLSEEVMQLQDQISVNNENKEKSANCIAELEQNLCELKTKLNDITAEADEFKAKRDTLENDVERITQDRNNLLEELRSAGLECERLGAELDASDNTVQDLLENVEEYKNEINQLQTKLKEEVEQAEQKDVMCTSLKGEVIRLNDELDIIRKTTAENEIEMKSEFHKQLENVERELEELREVSDNEHKSLKNAESTIDTLTKEMGCIKDELSLAIQEKTDASATINDLTQRLSCDTDMKLKEHEDLNNIINDLRSKINVLEQTNEKLNDQINFESERIASIDEIENRAKEQESLLDQLRNEHQTMEQKYHDLLVSFNTSEKKLEETTLQVKDLQLQNEKFRCERDELFEQLQMAGKESEQLGIELENTKFEFKRQYEQMQQTLSGRDDKILQLNDRCLQYEKDLQELLSDKTSLTGDFQNLKVTRDDLVVRLNDTVKERDSLIERITKMENVRAELEKRGKSLAAEKIELMDKVKQLYIQVQGLENDTSNLKEEKRLLTLQTEEYAKEADQCKVIDLEMEDYKRSLETSQAKVLERDEQISKLNQKLREKEDELANVQINLESVQQTKSTIEEKFNKLKSGWSMMKKELANAKAKEAEQKSVESDLRNEIEQGKLQIEEHKIEVASLSAELSKVKEKGHLSCEELQERIYTLESNLVAAQAEKDKCSTAFESMRAEYDSYKVRVHSVLKNQKSKSSMQTQLDNERRERLQFEQLSTQLKEQVEKLQSDLSKAAGDKEELDNELEQLKIRHSTIAQHFGEKEKSWKDQLEQAASDASLAAGEQAEAVRHLMRRNEVMAAAFKDEMQTMNENHAIEIEKLQIQLDDANQKLYKLQQQQIQQQLQQLRLDNEKVDEKSEMEANDQVETDPIPNQNTITNAAPSLEKILSFAENSSGEHSSSSVATTVNSPTDENLIEQLKAANQAQLNVQKQKVDHLSQLLKDSEDHCSVMTEQAKVLKEEIRRMERNQARSQELSNLEYLKNIILKFILAQHDEKEQLIPVVTTLLKLTQDEKSVVIERVKKNRRQDISTESNLSGLGSFGFLSRWK